MEMHPVHTPQTSARLGGLLYLIIIVGGLFGEAFIRGRLIIPNDATATAENILAAEALWRIGIANEFLMLLCTTVLALILYRLLRPVNRDLALLAVFFNLISIAVEATNEIKLLETLSVLKNTSYLQAFSPEQLNVLAHLPARAYSHGFGGSLIFFGCECVILGYLIFRSGYFPKTIGILMQIAGLCYLINSFALIVSPAIANVLFPTILLPAFVGEASLCLWLLIKGVNREGLKRHLPSA